MGRTDLSPWRAAAWPVVLAVVTVAGSLAASCLMPFTALAAIAAATLPPGRAALAVIGAWAANQAIGFGLLGYPHTGQALGQGASLLAAALLAQQVARAVGVATGGVLRLCAGFVAGFVAYEALLLAAARVTGGLDTFTPAIVAQVAVSDALWFAVLLLASLTLQRAAPGLAPHRPLSPRLA
ncbi:MAG: hypothetical protein GC203_07360 [Phenylobacterium sp.]|uniref:hypothetical protein n=1 Tax=Phenylobacterium sp. TaxID=1871053 RepID=UPI0025DC5311|nr:hypothetical protein [Phenylobacterium sp.]MBI1197662.1 hypothetical protein [Phenylobacterium sp.]